MALMELTNHQLFALISTVSLFLICTTLIGISIGLSKVVEVRQRRAEMRRLERRFADVIEVAADWVWETDAEMRFTFFSQRLEEVTGIDPKTLLGTTRYNITGDDSENDPTWRAHRATVAARLPFRDFRYGYLGLDGRNHTISISGKPIWDERGGFLGYRGTGRDLTDEIEAQERANDSERLARKIVDGNLDVFIVFDEDGVVIDWNPQAERTFGWPADEAIGRNLTNLTVPPELVALHRRTLTRIRNDESCGLLDRLFQSIAMDRDGRRFAVEISISQTTLRSQRVFHSFMRDITDRKRHESELHKAKEEAEAASRAKSEFLAAMSHELRTPLNAILGFSELLEQMPKLEEMKRQEYARDIHNSGRHLLDLINDVLDLAKIEAGRFELYEEEVDLDSVFRGCERLFRERAAHWGLNLIVEASDQLPKICADGQRIKQILINLLSNAIKFTGEGGTVRLYASRDGTGNLVLHVEDNGVGIAKDKIALAGEAFMQIDGGLQRRQQGTGLGLSLVKKMTELHGGKLEIVSEEGKGTTVSVIMPPQRVFDEDFHDGARQA